MRGERNYNIEQQAIVQPTCMLIVKETHLFLLFDVRTIKIILCIFSIKIIYYLLCYNIIALKNSNIDMYKNVLRPHNLHKILYVGMRKFNTIVLR